VGILLIWLLFISYEGGRDGKNKKGGESVKYMIFFNISYNNINYILKFYLYNINYILKS
jgi:hypothetical protein